MKQGQRERRLNSDFRFLLVLIASISTHLLCQM